MKISSIVFQLVLSSLLSLIFFAACNNSPEVIYLDSNFPGLKPKLYAPGIISLPNRFEHGISIRKNGEEHYFTYCGSKYWTYDGIIRVINNNGSFFIDTLRFLDRLPIKNKGITAGEANLSVDQKTMFFVSDYPTDVWKMEIDDYGNWGEPIKLDTAINSENSQWFPIESYDGCLYFSNAGNDNGVIYKAQKINNEFKKVSVLEGKFNYNCGDQVFPKEMDYIIFASPREGGFGNNDLYVAFKKSEGTWTDGVNLGEEINTSGFELAPFISPDDKFLFFTRRDKMNDAESSDIYWVSLDIISYLKDNFNKK